MSDISLKWGLLEYATIALILCGPGAVIGLVIGATGWTERRVLGALLGALEGFAVFAGYLYIYVGSDLSQNNGAGAAAFQSFFIAAPGIAIGGAGAAWLWRGHRVLGGIAGAAAGFVLWLYGWWMLQ